MPGSATTPGHPGACDSALECVAFRYLNSVGAPDIFTIAARWLAWACPYQRFVTRLAACHA